MDQEQLKPYFRWSRWAVSTIALTLISCGATEKPTAAQLARGHKLYQSYCLACHQASGAGVPGAFPALAGTPVLRDTGGLIKATLFGRKGTAMPSHCNFSHEDIADLLTYVQNAWSSTPQKPISAKEVLKISSRPDNPRCEPVYKK
jgi:cytochrome c oxidase subunit II